jgi:hypothetical protein
MQQVSSPILNTLYHFSFGELKPHNQHYLYLNESCHFAHQDLYPLSNTKDLLNELIAKHTGQKLAKVKVDTERDKFMMADEALAYGLIDKIITKTDAKN